MRVVKNIVFGLLVFLFLAVPGVFAAPSFSLVAPAGQLSRGQNIQFTVKIDTAGEAVTTSTVTLRYDTKYLKFISAQPADAADAINSTEPTAGEVVLSGTSNSYTGVGNYAVLTFNIVADAPGGTELCTVYSPTNSTTTGSSVVGSTSTTGTTGVATTSTQSVADLPQSGAAETTLLAVIGATVALSTGFILRRHA